MAFPPLLEGPLVILQSERDQGPSLPSRPQNSGTELYHHLVKYSEVAAMLFWTVERMRNYPDAHLYQVDGHHDELVAGCIILVLLPPTEFDEMSI